MKKLLILSIVIVMLTGCKEHSQVEAPNNPLDQDEIFSSCVIEELDKALNFADVETQDIAWEKIIPDNQKIGYYYGVSSTNNPDNMYVLLKLKDMTYDFDVMHYFVEYFSHKFNVFQNTELGNTGLFIYLHNEQNTVDFSDILAKCNESEISTKKKELPNDLQKSVDATDHIVIKIGDKVLNTVTDKTVVNQIKNGFKNSYQYGDAFLCDNYSFTFDFYDKSNKIIESFYVWYDGHRVAPTSSGKGCGYYTIGDNLDLRTIIEAQTDYLFYGIIDNSIACDRVLEKIYEDQKYEYYLSCQKSADVLVSFDLTKQTMPLKYALKQGYISAALVHENYPDILFVKAK